MERDSRELAYDEARGDSIVQTVEENGDLVAMNSKDCVFWQLDHTNCAGCSSEIGCCKVNKLLSLYETLDRYRPRDFDDYVKMTNYADDKQAKILACKSVGEIEKMPRL